MRWQPFRELYIPLQSVPTISITGDTTLDPIAQNVMADASGGPLTVTFAPFASWIGLDITVTKSDSSVNAVTWVTGSGSDVVLGLGTTGMLTSQGQSLDITATQST